VSSVQGWPVGPAVGAIVGVGVGAAVGAGEGAPVGAVVIVHRCCSAG
jgi:hypothetical protein